MTDYGHPITFGLGVGGGGAGGRRRSGPEMIAFTEEAVRLRAARWAGGVV